MSNFTRGYSLVVCRKCGKPTNVLVNISCHWFLFFDWLAEERPQKVVHAVVGSFKHYAGGFWKPRFHFENASYVFRSHYAGKIWKLSSRRWFWIFVWVKLRQGNVVPSSFRTRFSFSMFSVHTKTRSPCLLKISRFQNRSESSVFVTD